MTNRELIEQREKQTLAPYAMFSKDSRGRKYPQEECPIRTVYQRDRDRIIHCSAFRRLEYKTQVFVNHEGDYYRTRLTHTIEVAQISRTIARALGLNEDLAEAIALAHDLGHTPFGHAGEEILNEIMLSSGDRKGFEHNEQGLRMVDLLEERYPDFDGLNLSYELREGILKHKTAFDNAVIDTSEFSKEESPSLEAQVVNIADTIAYDNHDLDDGLKSKLFTEGDLRENVPFWKEVYMEVHDRYSDRGLLRKNLMTIRNLINLQVGDLIDASKARIKEHKIKSIKDVRKTPDNIINFSHELTEKRRQLENYLMINMYQHYRVQRMCAKAKRFIKELFDEYVKNPRQMPVSKQKKIEKWGIERIVCDYISEMTDRYALDEYKKLFDPYEKV